MKWIDADVARENITQEIDDWIDNVRDTRQAIKDYRYEMSDPIITKDEKEQIKAKFKAMYPHINFSRPTAPRLFIRATQGIGKTRAIISAIQKLMGMQQGKILIVVPNHRLATEFYNHYIESGEIGDIFHVRGRGQPAVDYYELTPVERTNGETMCKTPALVEAIHALAIDATESWCKAKGMCPFQNDCDWLAQRDQVKVANIILATHDSLYLPIIGKPKFNIVFVDEELRDFQQIKHIDFPINHEGLTASIPIDPELIADNENDAKANALRNFGVYQHKLAEVFRKVADAGGTELLQALRATNIKPGDLRHCVRFLKKAKGSMNSKILADLGQQNINNPENLNKLGVEYLANRKAIPHAKIAMVFELVARELKNKSDNDCISLGVRSNAVKEGMEYYVTGTLFNKPPKLFNSVAVLYADGTGSREIAKETFGQHIKTVEINVKRHMRSVLVTKSNISKTSLSEKYMGSERKLKEILAVSRREEFDGVIAGLNATERLAEMENPYGVWSKARDLDIHFKKLRGSNVYENVNYLAVFGMPIPPVDIVEKIARGIALNRGVKFTPIEYEEGIALRTFPTQKTDIVFGQNATSKTVHTHYHPDPIGEEVRWTMCEAEVIQAIDRCRGVNANPDQPKKVMLFANCDLPDIEWSNVIPFHDFEQRGQTRAELSFTSTGILPLNATLWVQMANWVAPLIFYNIEDQVRVAQKEMAKYLEQFPRYKRDFEMEAGDVLEVDVHPTIPGFIEYLVCCDIERTNQRDLIKQYVVAYHVEPKGAYQKVVEQLQRIPNHFVLPDRHHDS